MPDDQATNPTADKWTTRLNLHVYASDRTEAEASLIALLNFCDTLPNAWLGERDFHWLVTPNDFFPARPAPDHEEHDEQAR